MHVSSNPSRLGGLRVRLATLTRANTYRLRRSSLALCTSRSGTVVAANVNRLQLHTGRKKHSHGSLFGRFDRPGVVSSFPPSSTQRLADWSLILGSSIRFVTRKGETETCTSPAYADVATRSSCEGLLYEVMLVRLALGCKLK